MLPTHPVHNPSSIMTLPLGKPQRAGHGKVKVSERKLWMGFCDPGWDPMPDIDPIPLIIKKPTGSRRPEEPKGKRKEPASKPKKKKRA